MKICKWTRDHVGNNDNIRERLKVENITERCRKQDSWFGHVEARQRLRQKKDSGDGTTREEEKRKAKAEMAGMCQPRHEIYRYNRRTLHNRTVSDWKKTLQ